MQQSTLPSSDQKNTLATYLIQPDGEVRAMVQIAHGMCEYFLRYLPFGEFLAKNGILVFGHDHLGHGNTASTPSDRGFTASGGGWDFLVRDVHSLSQNMKAQYPKVPLILFGHSMGSFIAREVVARYPDTYDGAVFCGTGGPEAPAGLGRALASILMLFQGERHRSRLLRRISFMGYNKRFGKGCEENAWLTRDDATVQRYKNDDLCRFIFTLRAYHDLFSLLSTVSKKQWAHRLQASMPMLLISGEDDPVGGYGKGVRTVQKRILSAGATDLTTVLYPKMRHEILNELDKESVWEDILKWLESKLPSQT